MFIKEPEQTVYNDLYFQRLFEKDNIFGLNANSPVNEYLSRLINLNLKSYLNLNFNNCVLSGFDVIITKLLNNTVTLSILPGMAILNNFLFELNVMQEDVDILLNSTLSYLVVSLKYKLNDKNFSIEFDLFNDDSFVNNSILDPELEELLPIKIFKLQYKDNTINILNLDNGLIYTGGDFENNTIHYFLESLYLGLIDTGKLSEIKPLNRLFDRPKLYNINNKDYLIPNYGRHYNFAFDLLQKFNKNSDIDMITNYPVPNVFNIFSGAEFTNCPG